MLMNTTGLELNCRGIRAEVSAENRRAFTIIELLVVSVTVAIGLMLLAPALARTRPASQAVQCLNNLRQLMNAMDMYTQEHAGLFPPNPDDGNTTPGHNWVPGQGGRGGGAEFNPDILADSARCRLAPYLGTNVSVFACSADLRTGLYQGTDPRRAGTFVRAARSVSLNGAVGTVCPAFAAGCSGHSGIPSIPVYGTWLTGNHACSSSTWRTYGKTSDIVNPTPSSLVVLLEEDGWSINDGFFACSAGLSVWIDYPATAHNLAGVVAFADGHAELRKWVETSTRLNGGPVAVRFVASNDRDWLWLKARMTAPR